MQRLFFLVNLAMNFYKTFLYIFLLGYIFIRILSVEECTGSGMS